MRLVFMAVSAAASMLSYKGLRFCGMDRAWALVTALPLAMLLGTLGYYAWKGWEVERELHESISEAIRQDQARRGVSSRSPAPPA